ncbi:uridine kinase [Craterilacuibacter sinensis]|uniref:Uridine kinase n=1 Tax=Craterilacuibacter sinensis TaxID=2686017 RepID=A0A845BME5_9NEIS|nr:uridine kinase [Craterilacuibacter sinensis]MXR35621.1 uridine kinase [Craterilacuibacter sinensis]RQW29427.1 uridine kinase [Rhodobacteraceae bacterium CH30]
MSTPFIIGVAGGSGSGKTTVTRKVVETIGSDKAAVIIQDNYYRDQSHLTMEQRLHTNYDHPHAFDWPLLIEHIDALKNGVPIEMPIYDFANHTRAPQTETVVSAPVIVIEGIFALYDSALRDLMSLKIFVDTDGDVRFIRRLQRDIAERGRTMASVIEQYLGTVRPMHNQFVEPTKRFADVILPHGVNDPAVDLITARVGNLLK